MYEIYKYFIKGKESFVLREMTCHNHKKYINYVDVKIYVYMVTLKKKIQKFMTQVLIYTSSLICYVNLTLKIHISNLSNKRILEKLIDLLYIIKPNLNKNLNMFNFLLIEKLKKY